MGSQFFQAVLYGLSERPQHRVTLTKGFYLSVYPVTQAQWQAVKGSNPSSTTGSSLPVESVNWDECQEFCKLLSQ